MVTKNYGVRIDPQLKEDSTRILEEIGIGFPDAIRLFLKQVVNRRELPIELKMPNQKTLAAMKELEERNTNTSKINADAYLDTIKELTQ